MMVRLLLAAACRTCCKLQACRMLLWWFQALVLAVSCWALLALV